MNWISFSALYFITWWTVLFAVLPFGLRTQQDDENVTLGTVPSAPRGRHMRRALLWTTVVTSVIIGLVFVVVDVLGFGFDDLPIFVPT